MFNQKEYMKIYNKSPKVKLLQKKWRKRNPEKCRVYSKAWAKANPKKVRASQRAWTKAYPERRRAYSRAWTKVNPEKALLSHINQRCNNPKAENYSKYGGKGIKNFLSLEQLKILMIAYDYYDMRDKGEHPQIHRCNPNGDYCLENCVFMTRRNHALLSKRRKKELK